MESTRIRPEKGDIHQFFSSASSCLRRAILLLIAALLGCGRSDATRTSPTLRLGYFANATHAQAVLGADSGEFAQAIAPAELKTRVFNAGPALIEALFAGEIDIGYVGPGPALAAHAASRGEAIRVISGAAANGVSIVARPGSGIESPKDLAGKRIATPQHGNTQDISARHYVTAVLGQKDHANVLPIPNAEQAGMMSRGQIDAAWVPEPWGARLVEEAGAKLIGEEKDLWPGGQFSLTVVVTTPEFLKAHADIVEKVLAVHHRWTQRLAGDPGRYQPQLESALVKLTGKKLPPGVLGAALPRVKFTDDPMEDTFRTIGQWSHELGFAREPARLEGLFDLTIVRKLK